MIAMLMAAALAAAATDAAPATASTSKPQAPCGGRMSFSIDLLSSHLACQDPYGRLPPLTMEDPLTLGDARARFTSFSGLMLDVAGLAAPDGAVPPQGEILRVPVRPAVAGKITAVFDARGVLGGSASRVLPVGADVYGVVDPRTDGLNWCAAISDKGPGEPPDHAVCFEDSVKSLKGVMNVVGGLTVLNSRGGDNPYAPGQLKPDMLSKFTERPAAEAVQTPYPVSFPLIVRYLTTDKDEVVIRAEYGAYPDSQGARRFKRGTDGSFEFEVAGGRVRLTPEGGAMRVTMVKPIPKDALLQFRPGRGPSPAPEDLAQVKP